MVPAAQIAVEAHKSADAVSIGSANPTWGKQGVPAPLNHARDRFPASRRPDRGQDAFYVSLFFGLRRRFLTCLLHATSERKFVLVLH